MSISGNEFRLKGEKYWLSVNLPGFDGLSSIQPASFCLPSVATLPIPVNQVLRYVVGAFDGFFRLVIPVPPHHLTEAGPRVDAAYSSVHDISAVGTVSALVSPGL